MKDSQSVNFTLDIRNVDKTTVIKVIYEIAEVCKMFNIHYECDSDSVTKSKVAEDVAFEERLAA